MDDLISKQAAIDALNHELRCGAVINQCGLEMAYEVIDGLPSAQPEIKQQVISSSDCIDRRAALDAIRPIQTYKLFEGDDMILIDKAEVQTELMLLPSAQPEPKRGKWILKSYRWECDQCGCLIRRVNPKVMNGITIFVQIAERI